MLARLRNEEGVVNPGLGPPRIGRGRDDIIVAGQDKRLLQLQTLAREAKKSVHPVDFIDVFLGPYWISVGQIQADDPQDPRFCRDQRLEEARLHVGLVADQARSHLVEWALA